MRISYWSSAVCSSDLDGAVVDAVGGEDLAAVGTERERHELAFDGVRGGWLPILALVVGLVQDVGVVVGGAQGEARNPERVEPESHVLDADVGRHGREGCRDEECRTV